MSILSHLDEVILRIDALVKEQKEIAHNAIDLTDWQEAQTQLKQAQANITSLKAWKERITSLEAEIIHSGLSALDKESYDTELARDTENNNLTQIDIHKVIEKSKDNQSENEVGETEDYAFPTDTEISDDTDTSLADNEENRKQKAQESSDSEAEIPASDVIRICEDLILKNPFHMAMAFFSQAFSDILAMQESNAHTQFVAPYKLSNGLWIETDHITDDKINQIKDFCSTTII